MKHLFFWAFLGLSFVFASVSTDYDHSVDFGRYKTYSWLRVEAGDSLWADRIMNDVDRQLAAKGWTRVPSGGDAVLAAFSSTQIQPTLRTFYDGFGGGWGWQGFADGIAITTVENTPIGTLVVDIFDSRTKKLIWRGTDAEALSHKPEKNEKKLEKEVEKIFKHFPPPSKG
jgi:Domain of unknown function (DUF4136)